jgi:hypothetical protein
MATAALHFRTIGRVLTDIAAAWTKNRSAGSSLSVLAALSEDQLRELDKHLRCTGTIHAPALPVTDKTANTMRSAEPASASRVIPFAPPLLRRGALDRKSASVLP